MGAFESPRPTLSIFGAYMWPWPSLVDLTTHMYSSTLVDFTHFSSFGGHTTVYGGLYWFMVNHFGLCK